MTRNEVFFDTNILVYAAAPEDRRGEIALQLIGLGGTINVQVMNEFAVAARRKLKWAWPDIEAMLKRVRTLCEARPLGLPTHEAGLRIAASTKYHFYDCLIIAAALEARCTTLLSEDMQHGQVIEDRLTIRNPFLA